MQLSRLINYSKVYPKTIMYKLNKNIATLEYQKEALKTPEYAYYFANNYKGADIEKCQDAACQNPRYAYFFAMDITGADIEKCRKAVSKDEYWKKKF